MTLDAVIASPVGNDVVDLGDPETPDGACHARFDARVFAPAERALLAASVAPARLRWILWAAKEAAYKVARKGDRATVFSPARFVVGVTSVGAMPSCDAHFGATSSGAASFDATPCTRAVVAHRARRYDVALDVRPPLVHAVAREADCEHALARDADCEHELTSDADVEHAIARSADADADARDAGHARATPITLLSGVARLASGATTDPGEAARTLAVAALAPHLGVAPGALAVVRDGRIPRLRHGDHVLPLDLSLSHHGRFVAFACSVPTASSALEATS